MLQCIRQKVLIEVSKLVASMTHKNMAGMQKVHVIKIKYLEN